MSNRDGSFRTPVQMATDLESFQVQAVDVNNDGIPDLLFARPFQYLQELS